MLKTKKGKQQHYKQKFWNSNQTKKEGDEKPKPSKPSAKRWGGLENVRAVLKRRKTEKDAFYI